ncbi:GlxA family transcriptional regulator [Aquabacterium sp.]|uniref:GlxA family transcriptional regulator n=1 Tax=Aquabacterium sp. TaxID=1872578 RepID=UPI002C2848CE|nr:helix-turn-helix domain-containing protein [Aquabacterium sp.]HSW06099.1 helix-turn-helix domain-containing protein [Aquabacterium sp.]
MRLLPGSAAAIDLLFVVLPDTLLLDLAGPAEAFRLANQALQRRGHDALFRLRYIGPLPQVASSVGLTLANIEPLPAQLAGPSWVVLLGRPGDAMQGLRRQRAWLTTRDWLSRTLWPQLAVPGAPHRLLTVCVGALLAADAGLIGTRRCTTHHELLDELAALAPQAQVLANRVFVEDGPLLSSAGITAGIDLALHCIAQHAGDALAATVAQVMVVHGRRHAQDPQRSPLLAFRDHLHPAVHRVQEAVCERPGDPWSAEALSGIAHVTSRQLTRLFREHTGLTPRAYVEHVRVALAQQALRRGASGLQAADLAGFSSDRQWRRAKARHGGSPAHRDVA